MNLVLAAFSIAKVLESAVVYRNAQGVKENKTTCGYVGLPVVNFGGLSSAECGLWFFSCAQPLHTHTTSLR